ncbi:MAG: helix-turn-helix domain-containing protein [Flavobacteriales bacterium]|jgi:transcriptional regulator with XRE-family HTH domain
MNSSFCVNGKAQLKDQKLLRSTVDGLKVLRKQRNLTQEDFYNDTGIHISRVETGRVNVTLSTLKTILDYYQVPLSVFFQSINL